jgi:flagellin
MKQLWASIGSIQTRTKFSGVTLLGATADITIKASNVASDNVTIDFAGSTKAIWVGTASAGGTNGAVYDAIYASVASGTFNTVISTTNTYITSLDTQRAKLGALQNQMDYAVSNVTEMAGNLTAARSRVIDTDYATETASLTKGQILQQAATAMLAQANQMPNVILSLLK